MPCPIYIWAPLAAAAVPVARAMRSHFTGMDFGGSNRREKKKDRKQSSAPRETRRWAPVDPGASRAADAGSETR